MMQGHEMIVYMNMMSPQMWFFMILIWGFAIFGLVCVIRWLVRHARHNNDHHSL